MPQNSDDQNLFVTKTSRKNWKRRNFLEQSVKPGQHQYHLLTMGALVALVSQLLQK